MEPIVLSPIEAAQRRSRKRWILVLAVLAVMLALGWWRGPRVYSHWRQGRLIRQARELLATGEFRKADLCLRQVVQMNNQNTDAFRAMAELAVKANNSVAVALREKVCQMDPNSIPDTYAWAEAALKFGNIPRAKQALAHMKEAGTGGARLHEVEGRIELATGHLGAANVHFSEAVRLDPANGEYQVTLAAIAIQSVDPAVRAEARGKLAAWRRQPAFRLIALRALAADAAIHGTPDGAWALAQELAEDPGAGFKDHLLRLGFALRSRQPAYPALFAQAQERAKADAQEILQLLDWMQSQSLLVPACAWAKTLPPATGSKPPVCLKVADLHVLLLDWKGLRQFTESADWSQEDFLRRGFLARALLESGEQDAAQKEWDAAVELARTQTHTLTALERMARGWGWDIKSEELLWLIIERPEQPRWAYQALVKAGLRQRDSAKLYTTWSRLLELNPADSVARENWVVLSLLRRENTVLASTTASELYTGNSADPHLAAIHAFSLHIQGKTRAGLNVLRKLSREQLEEPSIAAYYGILLASEGLSYSEKYLNLANEAGMFPEEKELLAQARRKVGKQ